MNIFKRIALQIPDKAISDQLEQVFQRKGLTSENRVLCAIAALQAASEWYYLTIILNETIQKPADIRPAYEILLQGYLFCGYPRAIESFYCLEQVLSRKKLVLPADLPIPVIEPQIALENGKKLAGMINRDKFLKIHDKISALSPDLGYLMIVEGYGNILSRDGADIKTRELAIVSSLSASGAIRQLNSHIRGALNVGCTKRQIMEAIVTGFPWIGKEKVLKSLAEWSKVTEMAIPGIVSIFGEKV